ncbi:leucyl aminopeptidase [Bacillaceae bacterium SIJ1]|uniref:leucyl aminopeptidase n=1 Tax=Litoribacterium kuwaitense TaxID=1398745 RepID=UPI0013EA411F|nr:leucyl aminopeptidase [Litoribacterium kuwaitense]NGP46624.1 leucyl aminopeptidase [Litoribacterium kuwaitense]
MNLHVKSAGTPAGEIDVLGIGTVKGENTSSMSLYHQPWKGLFTADFLKRWEKTSDLQPLHQPCGAEFVTHYFTPPHREDVNKNELKKIFGRLVKQWTRENRNAVALAVDTYSNDQLAEMDVVEAFGEALVLASYQKPMYTSVGKEHQPVHSVTLLTSLSEQKAIEAFERGTAFGEGTCFARTLVHIPGNELTATMLAEMASDMARDKGIEANIYEKEDMEKWGMGALLAVNQGSIEPPKLIVLRYEGNPDSKETLALVGKGITFDTGGYSIKSKDGLIGMKADMGGAASVLGAMHIIGSLKPKENILCVIPATDNMISGSAFKPDDVITAMNGKTIEVRNTDAEGRLALADAVAYSVANGATRVIDVATLTGGVTVALGDVTTGAMTNDLSFYKKIEAVSEEYDEPVWLLPSTDIYKKQVRNSEIADLNNSPGRLAHPIMGGLFVGEFAGDKPWVHLDIAGTATTSSAHELGPKGATGVMARTLAQLVCKQSEIQD